MTRSFALFLVVFASVNSCAGNLLLKYSRMNHAADVGTLEKFLSWSFVGGLFCYAINVLLFAKSLDLLEVSIAYPILVGISVTLGAVFAVLLLDEQISLVQVGGMALILVGISLLMSTA